MKDIRLELLTKSIQWEEVTETLINKCHITKEDIFDLHDVYYATLDLVRDSWE